MKFKNLFIVAALWAITIFGSNHYTVSANEETASTVSETAIRKGEEITITFALDNEINVKDIGVISGNLYYDDQIFEEVKMTDFTLSENWYEFKYNVNNNSFSALRNGDGDGNEVLTLHLKAKKELYPCDTEVLLTNLKVSNSKDEYEVKDISFNVQVISPNEPLSEKEDMIIPEMSQEITSVGILSPLMMLIYVGLGIAVTIIAIMLWKNNSWPIRIILAIAMVFCIGIGFYGNLVYTNQKGDLNDDKQIDDVDVSILQNHLLALQIMPKEVAYKADINNDGKITLQDLSQIIEKQQSLTTNYSVVINSAMEDKRFMKNEDIILMFTAEVTNDVNIKSIVVDGKDYLVQKDANIYKIKINSGDKAGIKDFHFTQVVLNNGIKVDVDYHESIEVLKSIPQVSDFTAEELVESGLLKLHFNIQDDDKALKYANLNVFIKDQAYDPIISMPLDELTNEIEIDIEAGVDHLLQISMEYDLNHRPDTQEDDPYKGINIFTKDLQFNFDYQFSFNNLATFNEQMKPTNIFGKDEKIILQFESYNVTKFKPEIIVIDGQRYTVNWIEDHKYQVIIPGFKDEGQKKIVVEKVILENGKEMLLNENNQVDISILKSIAKIKTFDVEEISAGEALKMKILIADEQGTLSNIRLNVYDDQGNIIKQAENIGLNYQDVLTFDQQITKYYTLELVANQDLSFDGSLFEQDIVLESFQVEAQPCVKVLDQQLTNKYFEKGEEIVLDYQLLTNQDQPIAKLVVNNQELSAEMIENGYFRVRIKAGNIAGPLKLNLNHIILADDKMIACRNVQFTEILKTIPKIENYSLEENIYNEEAKVTFEIIDDDGAFEKGKAELIAVDGSEAMQEQTFTNSGKNELTFKVKENKEYYLTIYQSYHRDSERSLQVDNEEALNKEIMIIKDYQLVIENGKTQNIAGEQTTYFTKAEDFVISFNSSNASPFKIDTIKIGEEEYIVEMKEDNVYSLAFKAEDQAGIYEIIINEVKLSNGKILNIDNPLVLTYEVLKDQPIVKDFLSQKTPDDKLSLEFVLEDEDNALIDAYIQVENSDANILLEEQISLGKNQIEFVLTDSENYQVFIKANYDLDSNPYDQVNNHKDIVIFSQEIIASKDVIELKDITKTVLYKVTEQNYEEIEVLDISQGVPNDLTSYIVKIEMAQLPALYADVVNIRHDDHKQQLTIDIAPDNVVFYDDNGIRQNGYSFNMAFRDENGDHGAIASAQEFFDKINYDLDGQFVLEQDLDASMISKDGTAIKGIFTGSIDGNGHTIYNLPTTMFERLSGAKISNLILKQASVTGQNNAILAKNIENKTIVEKVYIVDSTLHSTTNMVGTFAGALNNSTITESAAININVKASHTIGGLVGQTNGTTVIKDSYVTGKLQGTIKHDLGSRVGGIVGWHSGNAIERCFSDVEIISVKNAGNGGLIGGPSKANNSKIIDSFSICHGNAYRLAGFKDALKNAQNVYEHAEGSAQSNIEENNVYDIKMIDRLDSQFLATNVNFSDKIWHLELSAIIKIPSLHSDPTPKDDAAFEIENNVNDIPNYKRVRNHSSYQAEREIAYANMAKLMPFADSDIWIKEANALDNDNIMVVERIDHIIPLNQDGKVISGLDVQQVGTINKIRIIFSNEQILENNVTYQKVLGNIVAMYQVDGHSYQYQFNRFVKDLSEYDLSDIYAWAEALEYQKDIADITLEEESRLYTDHFALEVKPMINDFINLLILSQDTFPAYLQNDSLKSFVYHKLREEDKLEAYIYAYNYYRKWYDFNFANLNLTDLIYFNGTLLNEQMTIERLTNDLLLAEQNLRGTDKTYEYFQQKLQPLLNKEMLEFIAALAKSVGYDDPSDWMAAEFKGILIEQPAHSSVEGINYRIWDMFSNLGRRKYIVLPILSAPQEDMYIVTVPSQIFIGSMNRYGQYLNKDGYERERMENMIRDYVEKLAYFYGTSATWITNSKDILNGFVNIQYDTRENFPENNVTNAGRQEKGITNDPVIKWVYEAINAFALSNGTGAYANGTDVFWVSFAAIGNDFTFYALTHETAHNQDGRYFYAGYGRRKITGAEAHADGNIAQQIEDGSMVFNISKTVDIGANVTNNFSYERIDSAEKIHSYYRAMFETGYLIDYLQGLAFFKLTPEEQAKIAIKIDHVPEGKNSVRSIHSALTPEEFAAMQLNDFEDLWDNRIALKAVANRQSAGVGAYGYESFYDVNWYQSHYDQGTPDSSSFKRLAFEMLGVGGYEDGYVTYISAKSANDLEALRSVTNDPNITWKEYKLNRYKYVADNIGNITYFDPDVIVDEFVKAFKEDDAKRLQSIALKRTLYGIIKRATNDFSTDNIYESGHITYISSAQQLIDEINKQPMGHFVLSEDLDFTGIYPEGEAYVNKPFFGILDGNGHTIHGVDRTLFIEAIYAQISNITISAPRYIDGTSAYISKTARNSILENIKVENADISLPYIQNKQNSCYELNLEANIGAIEINNIDELLAINNSENAKR
ncbi:MAG: dockerin type I domain-containing protein, partial [Erysipelotrichaceae bacterium]|nr:dockerin type I domain-containing protein [Erysipelotrichaceae bacterium]